MLTTTKHAAKRELTATPPPRVRVSRQDLEFVSANQQLEGFPGQVTETVAVHEPALRDIAESARRFGAQVPTVTNRQQPPIFRTRRNGDQPA
jgi:hypothetical protein